MNTPYHGSDEIGNPDDRLNKQHTVILSGEVGLSERFSLQGLLPLRSFDITGREELSAEGAGDLELTLRTSLTAPERSGRFAAVVFYGAGLPTGKDSEASILEENSQFSRGVVSAIAGGQVNVRVGARSQLYGLATTQIPVGDDDGYRFGTTRSAVVTFSSSFGESNVRWLGGLTHSYAARDHVNKPGDNRGSVAVLNRGGRQTRLLGGLVIGLTRGQNVGLQANYLIDADLNGDQLVARVEFILGWQVSFGTHRHRIDHQEMHTDS